MTREIFSAKCKLGGLTCAAVVGAAAGAFQSYEVTEEDRSSAWKVALGQVGICLAAGAAMRTIDCVSTIYHTAHDSANALMVQKMLEEAKDKNIRLNTQRVTVMFEHETELACMLKQQADAANVSAFSHKVADTTVAGASGLAAGAAAAGTGAAAGFTAVVNKTHSTVGALRSERFVGGAEDMGVLKTESM